MGRYVTLLLFGLLGATNAVHTALFGWCRVYDLVPRLPWDKISKQCVLINLEELSIFWIFVGSSVNEL